MFWGGTVLKSLHDEKLHVGVGLTRFCGADGSLLVTATARQN